MSTGPGRSVSSRLTPGTILGGRYAVRSLLDEGGMGCVYLAQDQLLSRTVVIKTPHAQLLVGTSFRERFKREVRALTSLDHPNVVKVHDVGMHESTPFVVQQYLAGGTLQDRLVKAGGPTSLRAAIPWLIQVADALDYIHAKGLLHRDVKPGNILFDEHGHALLADFGLARALVDTEGNLTGQGAPPGSPMYMAPEVTAGEAPQPAYDQYSLAVVLYVTLSAHKPYEGDEPIALLARKMVADPVPLGEVAAHVPPSVSDVVMRAMSRKVEDRFPSCRAFADAYVEQVMRAGEQAGIPAGSTSPPAGDDVSQTRPVVTPSQLEPTPPTQADPALPHADVAATPTRGSAVGPWARRLSSPKGRLAVAALALTVLVIVVALGWDRGGVAPGGGPPPGRAAETQRPAPSPEPEPPATRQGPDIAPTRAPESVAPIGSTAPAAEAEATPTGTAGGEEPGPPGEGAPAAGEQASAAVLPVLPLTLARVEPADGAFVGSPFTLRGHTTGAELTEARADTCACEVSGPAFRCTCRPETAGDVTVQLTVRDVSDRELVVALRYAAAPPGLTPAGDDGGGPPVLIRERDGARVIAVPGGTFQMGNFEADPDEQPPHHVRLSSFYLDEGEVTLGMFSAFAAATGAPLPPQPDWHGGHEEPVVLVTWDAASAYCEWAGARLPTEAQWEYAARGGKPLDWPWGETFEPERANVEGEADGFPHLAPSTALPEGKSAFGLLNMAGNAAEWVADWHDPRTYRREGAEDPAGPEEGTRRVYRGGSFRSPPEDARTFRRRGARPEETAPDRGFRCAH